MPLEFALRPHFDLDRPVRRRRVVRSRFLRFAVPTVAYWLVIGGATYAFVSSVGEHSATGSDEAPSVSDVARSFEPPQRVAAPPPPSGPVQPATEADTSPEPAPPPPVEPAAEAAPEPPPMPAVAIEQASEPDVQARSLPPSLPPLRPEPRAPRTAAVPAAPAPAVAAPRAPPWVPAPDPFAALDDSFRAPERATAPRADAAGDRHERVASAAGADSRDRAQNEARAALLPSCESARASANETIEVGAARGAPDLTRDAFASVLEDGSYLNQCAVPARTALDICAAVQNGKVVGLTVTSEPRSPTINACVRRAVTALRFPHNARLDVTRTRFAPSR